jgi:hypothetical protein
MEVAQDVPHSDENARVFGRPGSHPGTRAAFPKVRLVILVEAATHLIFNASRAFGIEIFILFFWGRY